MLELDLFEFLFGVDVGDQPRIVAMSKCFPFLAWDWDHDHERMVDIKHPNIDHPGLYIELGTKQGTARHGILLQHFSIEMERIETL